MAAKVVFLFSLVAVALARPSNSYSEHTPSYHTPAPAYHTPAKPHYSSPAPSYHAPAQNSYHEPQYADVPPYYNNQYAVRDDYSGVDFSAQEARDGYKTEGSYRVLLPDGRIQTVTYYVDGDSGTIAEVTYEGEAQYSHAAPSYGHAEPSYSHKPTYTPAPSYGHAEPSYSHKPTYAPAPSYHR